MMIGRLSLDHSIPTPPPADCLKPIGAGRIAESCISPKLGLKCVMRVIAVATLRAFWENPSHLDAEQPLKAWYKEAQKASWTNPADIKLQYRSASVLKNRRVVFNIKGNDYRLVVAISYKLQIAYVKFIGTHKKYDAIDAETVELA